MTSGAARARGLVAGIPVREALPAQRRTELLKRGFWRYTTAIVWISIRNCSCTSRSTTRSVFGGYLPSANMLG